jgi:hypothetical protein
MPRGPVRMVNRNCEKCGSLFTVEHFSKKRFCNRACSAAMCWNRQHHMSNTPEHNAWCDMRKRCTDTGHHAYHLYGGRGITFCERWNKFENFYADMGPRPEGLTLDRIRVNENYEPGNCRWATRQVQAQNRRPWSEWTFRDRDITKYPQGAE